MARPKSDYAVAFRYLAVRIQQLSHQLQASIVVDMKNLHTEIPLTELYVPANAKNDVILREAFPITLLRG